MKMPAFISRLLPPQKPKAFAVRTTAPIPSGDQIVRDTRLLLNYNRFYVGLHAWEKIELYEALYRSNPIASGAVNTLVRLCNSRVNFKSGHPEVDARAREIWQSIKGHNANQILFRQMLIAGFAIGEWSMDSQSAEIDKLTVPPSREIRVRADDQGNIAEFVQIAGIAAPSTTDPYGFRTIPRAKCIYLANQQEHSFDYYGDSLFSSCIKQFADITAILNAQVRVYQRLGEPRLQIEIDATGVTEEEFQNRVNQVKSVMDTLQPGEDIILPLGCKITIIGAESFGARFRDECNYQITSALAGVGLPAALLHLSVNSGSTESWIRQICIILQSQLAEYQRTVAAAWNADFWPICAALENMPAVPVIEFQPPRLLEELQEQKARESRFINDKREVIAGFRSLEWLAQQCDVAEIDDPAAAAEWLDQQRTSGADQESISNEETNAGSVTKGTDSAASNNNNA